MTWWRTAHSSTIKAIRENMPVTQDELATPGGMQNFPFNKITHGSESTYVPISSIIIDTSRSFHMACYLS